MFKRFLFIIIISSTSLVLYSQNDSNQTFVLKGTIVNGYNNELLAGAHITVNKAYGTQTNNLGGFTLSVKGNDSLIVSFIGFKPLLYIVPQHEKGNYLTKFKLFIDSVSLAEVEIFPYPTYEEFKEAFIAMDKQDEQIEMAGVKMYQDRIVHETYNLPLTAIFTSPVSLIYDKLFDKKAKLKRKLERRKKTIEKAKMISD